MYVLYTGIHNLRANILRMYHCWGKYIVRIDDADFTLSKVFNSL